MSELSWYRKARLRTIETLAFWRGRINTRDLIEIFGISRQVAQGDIHRYMEQSSGNLIYRKSEKAYVATSIFKNLITSGSIDEWMALDSGHCQYVDKPQFTVKPELARPLIHAMRKGAGTIVMYRSMEHPDGIERSLYPHTLVYSGFRWHIRAWCCVREEFRDFNLSRISQVTSLNETAPSEAASDRDELWHQIVDIHLTPNPGLSQQEQSLIEAEFEMQMGQLKVGTRAALVMYTLQAYQVDPDQEQDIYKQRLVVSNSDEIAPYCW